MLLCISEDTDSGNHQSAESVLGFNPSAINLLMSVTIIKQLIELMIHTVKNLVIAYFYIILLYGIESQLYAMNFAQVKKFKMSRLYSCFSLWPYTLLAVVLMLG